MRLALPLVIALLLLPTLGVAGGATTAPAFTRSLAPPGWADNAGEPSLGVNPATGAVLFQSYASTYKVTFDAAGAATWRDVTPAHALGFNLDPILFTDREKGVTIAGGLEGECSVLWRTADDGATWSPLGNACASPAFDHETVASGPAPTPFSAIPGARAAYYCAQTAEIECAASLDGGLTFGPAVPVSPGPAVGGIPQLCNGPSGHVKVAADAAAYVTSSHCQARQGIMVTTDLGTTWTTREIPGSTVAINTFDASVATTRSGWAYVAYEDANQRQMASVTHDHGATWSVPTDVASGLGLRATAFSAAVAGDDARAAVAFLGTSDAGPANVEGFTGAWRLYVAFTTDGGQSWSAVQASPDVVHRGWICSTGLSCNSGRNLLDFIDATMDEKGRVLVAYAEGCLGCADVSGSWHQKGAIARQSAGLGLLASFD